MHHGFLLFPVRRVSRERQAVNNVVFSRTLHSMQIHHMLLTAVHSSAWASAHVLDWRVPACLLSRSPACLPFCLLARARFLCPSVAPSLHARCRTLACLLACLLARLLACFAILLYTSPLRQAVTVVCSPEQLSKAYFAVSTPPKEP